MHPFCCVKPIEMQHKLEEGAVAFREAKRVKIRRPRSPICERGFDSRVLASTIMNAGVSSTCAGTTCSQHHSSFETTKTDLVGGEDRKAGPRGTLGSGDQRTHLSRAAPRHGGVGGTTDSTNSPTRRTPHLQRSEFASASATEDGKIISEEFDDNVAPTHNGR